MTPPDPQQVAEIAGRLSKAQRRFLIENEASYRFVAGYKPGEKLVELGLLDRQQRVFGHRINITEFGLAVRNFIQGNSHD